VRQELPERQAFHKRLDRTEQAKRSKQPSVVERVGKRPFREFMRGEVLNRLQMTSSGFNLTGRDVAIGYQAGKAVPPHTFEPEAGGGCYTSAHDLALVRIVPDRFCPETDCPQT
jgi:Beta-lactamase